MPDKAPLPRRISPKNVYCNYVSCACTRCGFKHFAGLHLPAKTYGDMHPVPFLLRLVECPRCFWEGAAYCGYGANEAHNRYPHCMHPVQHIYAEFHGSNYAAVCLCCGERWFGGDGRLLQYKMSHNKKENSQAVYIIIGTRFQRWQL